MKLKLDDPRLLGNMISIISELVTEVRLKINKEGMNLVAVDPASVAMVYFNIPADRFSIFEVDKEEVLGVNLDNLKNVLRRCGIGSSLTLEKNEDPILKLNIQDKVKRDFALALIDIEGEEKDMPQWEFESVIKLDSDALNDVIEDCKVVSDACTFIAEPNKFIVEAKGLHSARAEFSSDEVEIHSGNSVARFSLEYLSKFIKGAKISDKAVVNFSDNHPMRINFPTGNIMLSFVLAPRVEQDD